MIERNVPYVGQLDAADFAELAAKLAEFYRQDPAARKEQLRP